MKQILRGVAVLAVGALVMLGFASTASAQTPPPAEYPPVTCTVQVTISGNTVTVIVTCTGFQPGVTITVTIDGAVAGETVVGPNGEAVLDADIANTCGAHTFSATDGTTTVDGTFDVPCGPATPVQPAGTLPFTGSDSLPVAQLGVALLAVGALITVVVRKRRAAQI